MNNDGFVHFTQALPVPRYFSKCATTIMISKVVNWVLANVIVFCTNLAVKIIMEWNASISVFIYFISDFLSCKFAPNETINLSLSF